jgi:hypothetical protein
VPADGLGWGLGSIKGRKSQGQGHRQGQRARSVRLLAWPGARCPPVPDQTGWLNESSHAHAPGLLLARLLSFPPQPTTWREVYIHPPTPTRPSLPPNPSHQLETTVYLAAPPPTTPHRTSTSIMKFSVVSALVGAAFVGFASAQK